MGVRLCHVCGGTMQAEFDRHLGIEDRWGYMYRCGTCGSTYIPED